MFIVVMGVSGCGKTTVGEALSAKLGWPFAEADVYHSATNKAKMAQGIPLTDTDRIPWLASLHAVMCRWYKENKNGIITCSALKKFYRTILIRGRDSLKQETGEMEKVQEEGSETEMDLSNTILFVYLKGSQEVIAQRIGSRKGHFMPASFLNSQFKTLEEPNGDENYIDVDVTQDVNEITDSLLDYISKKSSYFEI